MNKCINSLYRYLVTKYSENMHSIYAFNTMENLPGRQCTGHSLFNGVAYNLPYCNFEVFVVIKPAFGVFGHFRRKQGFAATESIYIHGNLGLRCRHRKNKGAVQPAQ